MSLRALPVNIALQAVPGGTAYINRALYSELIIYHISVALIKLSILLFYRRIISFRRFLTIL